MKKIVAEPYRDIDFSEARRGPVVKPEPGKTKISIRLDNRVIDHFRSIVESAGGGNYQTLINDALVAHIEQQSVLDAVRTVVREELSEMQARQPATGADRDEAVASMPDTSVLFLIPIDRFDDARYIERRLASVERTAVGATRTALRYLYLSDGPSNLPRDRLKKSESFLEPAERVVVRWLYTRTNGKLRSHYGAAALRAARRKRYRCEHCGHADVRVLNLDHVQGRGNREHFACLCSNCHCLKSRAQDWGGL